MLLLVSTSDKVQVVTSGTADLNVRANFMDTTVSSGVITADTMKPGNQHTAISTATTTDVVAAPGSNVVRNVKVLTARNVHASASNTVTVQVINGTSTVVLFKAALATGEMLGYSEGTWFVYDALGGVKAAGLSDATDGSAGLVQIATQAEMEAASSTSRAVTPGRLHFHPGAAKFWLKANGAGTAIAGSYNVTSIADTGTGRLGVTIATDFADTNYAVVASVERTVTALTATGVEDFAIRNASQLAGSVEIESYDHTATTMAAQDPANYHVVGFGDHA